MAAPNPPTPKARAEGSRGKKGLSRRSAKVRPRKPSAKLLRSLKEAEADRQEEKGAFWSNLIGYDEVFTDFVEQLGGGNSAPAHLVVGRQGVGKALLARKLAALHVCSQGNACGECESCLAVAYDEHPDVLILSPENQGGLKVAQIDALQEHVSVRPHADGSQAYRVVVLLDSDSLSPQASNRLLKVLEEPPENAVILMTTSRLERMLPTLRSRLAMWRLPRLSVAHMAEIVAQCTGDGSNSQERWAPQSDDSTFEQLVRSCFFSPAMVLERSRAGSAIREEQARSRCVQTLLTSRQPGAVVQAARELGRQHRMTAGELMQASEIELNALYRRAFAEEQAKRSHEGSMDRSCQESLPAWCQYETACERRDVLRQTHRALRGKDIAFHTQLLAEALGLAGYRGDISHGE